MSEPLLPGVGGGTSLREAWAPFRRRFLLALLYFSLVISAGSVGYRVVEGWRWLDCLYMSVITTTSVGYMEVHPLSDPGRIFTMFLLGAGILGLGIWWALITALILELDITGIMRRRRMERRIASLNNHIIVCGAGRMGKVVVAELERSGVAYVLVDHDPARIHALMELHPDMLALEADATIEVTLEHANVAHASGLASCLPNDADNLLLCLTARGLNADLQIVARAYAEESLEKLRRAGANHAISPNVTGAVRMSAALLRPSVISFLDAATLGAGMALRLEETEVAPNSPLVGQSLAEAKIPQRTGLIVLALRQAARPGDALYNPGPEIRLSPGDSMIVLGREEQIGNLRAYVSGKAVPGAT